MDKHNGVMYYNYSSYFWDQKRNKNFWYSALALWRPRRRFYFAIDEIAEELVYHKTEGEFTAHRDPLGAFPISTAVITLDENNQLAFILK